MRNKVKRGLTLQSLLVTIRTTGVNIKKFCMLITLHLSALFDPQNKQ